MESASGADFSGVRIHTGPRATELNHRIQAQAFTLGSDVFFRYGEPSAFSSGTRLLAHELTRTVQQGGARSVRRTVGGRSLRAAMGDAENVPPR